MGTYAVTGVAGFIGSNIAEKLMGRGHRVKGLDNFSTGKRENLAGLGGVELIRGDIRDQATCRKVCEGADYVLHHAAVASVPLTMSDPWMANDVNVNGTLNMLLASREAGVRRFVFAASSAVYGSDPSLPKREGMLPCPVSPYGVAKLAGEQYCRVFTESFGLPTVCLRYFNVFGKHQDPNGAYAAVIPRFVAALLSGEPPEIFGDGEQTRDFCFVEDVVAANLCACTAPGAPGGVFNIGSGRGTSLNELFHTISGLLSSGIRPRHLAPRQGDIRHSVADVTLAREKLGFRARYDVAGGLEETIGWYVDQASFSRRQCKEGQACAV